MTGPMVGRKIAEDSAELPACPLVPVGELCYRPACPYQSLSVTSVITLWLWLSRAVTWEDGRDGQAVTQPARLMSPSPVR